MRPTSWPPGDGEMAQRIRAHDWAATPLGPVEDWPGSLRTAVDMVLAMPGPANILWGPAHVQIYNDAYIVIAKDRHPALLGRSAAENWPEVHAEVLAPMMEAAFAGRPTRISDLSVTLHGPDGQPEERTFDTTWSPIRDASGNVGGALEILVEVTDRRRAQAALRESEGRLRLIVENTRDYAIFTTDPEGRIDTWLPGAAGVFGWSAEDVVGQPVALLYTLEDREAGVPGKELETARQEDIAPNVRWHLCKNGSRVFIEGSVTALRNTDGSVRGFLQVGQDVTARRRAEEANARLAAIVTSTTDAIISFDAEDGRILSWNRGAEELFEYTEAEAVGAPVGLLLPPDLAEQDPTGVFRRVMAGERVHEHATVRVTKSGERVAISITASRMLAPDGRVLGVSGIFRDMRQRNAAEERQTLLAREVDHRAKNALAVVQSIVHLTRDRDPEAFKRAIAGRIAALARAQTLLADDRWSGADLHTLLKGELAPFLGEHRAELDGPPVPLPPGAAQPTAMAVHELATNALKYGALSAPAGHLRVSWHLARTPDGAPLLRLLWTETGGPPVTSPPARQGFGSRVLEGTLRSQLGGQVSLEWKLSGLVCNVEIPLQVRAEVAGTVADT